MNIGFISVFFTFRYSAFQKLLKRVPSVTSLIPWKVQSSVGLDQVTWNVWTASDLSFIRGMKKILALPQGIPLLRRSTCEVASV